MMFTGSIYLVDDARVVLDFMLHYNAKVLSLASKTDNQTMFGKYVENINPVNVFLPPIYSSEVLDMGDKPEFYRSYYEYLSSVELDAYFSLILTGLYNGLNMILFVHPEEMSMEFVPALLNYIRNTYGVIVGTKFSKCLYDPNYEDIDRTRMFLHGYIPASDLVMFLHGYVIDPHVATLMCEELRIQIVNNNPLSTINEFIKYTRATSKVKLIQKKKSSKAPFYIKEGC